jgi:lipopolysaccharide transport system ATP-binding protein
MDLEVLVKVEGVRKKFCRSLKKSLWYGLKDMATEVGGRKGSHDSLRDGEFWAVDDVSFELRRGECLGLIGRNGAGKTTLLKMLNGLIKPDHGRIEMRGRVGALIALGAGFNPILTGRENILVNGSILGLTKREIEAKMDGIIEFAEIGDFIDSPVQSYSSGMQVRLGFAVATALEPDVLILDEVLAVGDRRFRSKCMARISGLLRKCAVLFVSHSAADVQQICDTALWMDRGRPMYLGTADAGLREYAAASRSSVKGSTILMSPVISATMESPGCEVKPGGGVKVKIHLEATEAVLSDYFVGAVVAESGETVCQFHPPWESFQIPKGNSQLAFLVEDLRLAPGHYTINALCCGNRGKRVLFHLSQVAEFKVKGGSFLWAAYQPETKLCVF